MILMNIARDVRLGSKGLLTWRSYRATSHRTHYLTRLDHVKSLIRRSPQYFPAAALYVAKGGSKDPELLTRALFRDQAHRAAISLKRRDDSIRSCFRDGAVVPERLHLLKKIADGEDLQIFIESTLLAELTPEEIQRQRYRLPGSDSVFGPRYGPAFKLYSTLIPSEHRWLLDVIVKELTSAAFFHSSSVRKYLKEISNFCKMNGDYLAGWHFLVNMDLFGGYVRAPPPETFLHDIESWVGPWPVVEPGTQVEGWRRFFSQTCSRIFSRVSVLGGKHQSYYEFVVGRVWARSGSSDVDVPVFVDVEGEDFPVRQTKTVLALVLSDAQLWEIATRSSVQQSTRALVKRELGKARAVAITDFSTYLKMAYAASIIEPLMGPLSLSTLFFSPSDSAGYWARLARQSHTDYIKFPIDQSDFDHNISFFMLDVVFEQMLKLQLGPDYKWCLSQCRYTLTRNPGVMKVGRFSVQIRRGVLSGWRFTAFFDTVINISQFGAALGVLKSRSQDVTASVVDATFQGDDARLLLDSEEAAVLLAKVYQEAGFGVNPSKTWVSRDRDEFLRRVAVAGRIFGYPARSLPSAFWRNPIKPPPADVVDSVRRAANGAATLIARGCDLRGTKAFLLDEVKHLADRQWSETDLRSLIATPPYLGGIGLPFLVDGVRPFCAPAKPPLDPWRRVKPRGMAYFDGVLARLAPLIPDGSGLPATFIRQNVQPFDPFLFRRSGGRGRFLPLTIPRYCKDNIPVMVRSLRQAHGPIRATFDCTLPVWAIDLAVRSVSGQGARMVIERWMDLSSRVLSPWIYSRHGKRTWIDWATGSLDLPIKRWLGYDPAYISTAFTREKKRVIAGALYARQPYRGVWRSIVEKSFYLAQPHPSSYMDFVIGD